jgi:hypothetical protein
MSDTGSGEPLVYVCVDHELKMIVGELRKPNVGKKEDSTPYMMIKYSLYHFT